mgnify:CR=1 FL=1
MYFVQNRVRCVKLLCAALAFLLSLSLMTVEAGAHTNFRKTIYSITVDDLDSDDLRLSIEAVYSCACAVRNYETTSRALINAKRLLAVERSIGVPEIMIGMSLAAACSESCYNDFALGDHKFSKNREPKAVGILQLWPWVHRYGVDRKDLESSAGFWLSHIMRLHSKTVKKCKPRTKLLSWRQAWVTGVRAPKKGGRCREVPKHWRNFKKIQKIKKAIEAGEFVDDPDGC